MSSCFFEYAFLNYLKENKIYPEYVSKCLDDFFKELIHFIFIVNLISKKQDLLIDSSYCFTIEDDSLIKCGEKIKERLNYYEFPEYDKRMNIRFPYIYGFGKLLSIYLYENFKENPNFLDEFKKILSSYQFNSDISVFDKVGINKEKLLKGEVFTKVLKKHCEDFR